jgi:hypothetical protein
MAVLAGKKETLGMIGKDCSGPKSGCVAYMAALLFGPAKFIMSCRVPSQY